MFSRYCQIAQRSFATGPGAGINVGFIGLGCMGLPMSSNLKKAGYNVKGFDLSPEARNVANEAGITTVDTLGEAAQDVDYVVTALPRTENVEEALKGDGGIYENAKQGTYICDTSTICPTTSA